MAGTVTLPIASMLSPASLLVTMDSGTGFDTTDGGVRTSCTSTSTMLPASTELPSSTVSVPAVVR